MDKLQPQLNDLKENISVHCCKIGDWRRSNMESWVATLGTANQLLCQEIGELRERAEQLEIQLKRV